MIAFHPPEEARDIWSMTQKCMLDIERKVRRHPSCWVLNYRYFRKKIKESDQAALERRYSRFCALEGGQDHVRCEKKKPV